MVAGWPAEEVKDQPDPLCQMLFDAYIVRGGKINTATVMTASHIIAERGRNMGFWKNVLRELKSGEERSEIGCVRVLGKMLAIDAAARAVIRREKEKGEVGQWMASVCLGPEVVEELVARGRGADRFRADHYAIALMRAGVPEATEFFRMLLRDDADKRYLESARFHAAVGLAQLGEADGFEWLIRASEDPVPTVGNTWPSRVPNLNLDTCSVAALRELSGEKQLQTRQEWEVWWEKKGRPSPPRGHVKMEDQ